MDIDNPIKQDPDEGSLSPIGDDDQFEDAGELEIPKVLPKAWMIKVPNYIYKNWSEAGPDQPLQLGKIRRFASGRTTIILDNQDNDAKKLNRQLPLQYEMREATHHASTFLFSEKDLPSDNHRRHIKRDPLATHGENGVGKRQRGRSWRTRSVPKQTKIAAKSAHDAQWFPIENEQYAQVMHQRNMNENRRKAVVKFETGSAAHFGSIIMGETRKNKDGGFGNFVGAAPPTKPQKQKDKAIRMDKTELTHQLTELFRKYDYYHLSTLRNETNQPEAWIREVLKDIADYISAGHHATTFRLNADTKNALNMSTANVGLAAPKIGEDFSEMDTGDDDDDNLELEDVKS